MTYSPLEDLSNAIASFSYKDAGVNCKRHQIEVFAMFSQLWGDTSLGFGGVGGQSMTSAYTIVINAEDVYCVYFAGRFAYKLERSKDDLFKFVEDVNHRFVESVTGSIKYRKTKNLESPQDATPRP